MPICTKVSLYQGESKLRILILFVALIAGIDSANSGVQRVFYKIDAAVDYDLLTLKGSAEVNIPNNAREVLRDAVFFLYANSSGLVSDERRKHIVVDGVWLGREAIPFSLDGAILRVTLNTPQNHSFILRIEYHGIVPRSAGGGIGLSFGGLGGMIGNITGNPASGNSDYGLYCYSDGILSLGSFWYPQLAVRKNGQWVDEAPKGLGDVAYAEASDFDVGLTVPANVKVETSGEASGAGRYIASNVRDFAVLMSEDFVCNSKSVEASGKSVTIEACATRKNAARLDSTLNVAAQALQTCSTRFGEYPYKSFKVVEGTLRGGAGGMEFSAMTAIAPMLYTDWKAQLSELSGLLGKFGGLDKLLGGLNPSQETEAGKELPASPPANSIGNLFAGFFGQQSILDSLMEMTIAHEVAHQWWAIAVGSDSIREPFVDESLTNYSAVLYFEDRYGRETAEKMINMHLKMPYSLSRLLGQADAPANLPTSAYGSSLRYSAIVYGKGALYYDSLRRAAGDEAFFSALRAYYATYRGSLAGPRSLLDIVSAKAPTAGAEALYKRWIEGTYGDQDISGAGIIGIQDILGKILKGASPTNQ